MKRLVAILCLFACLVPDAFSNEKTVIVEATVVRVEPWSLVQLACGIYANYRLAEYRIEVGYLGQFRSGEQIVVKHLACNYNELDDLKPGDRVVVVAEALAAPEKGGWRRNDPTGTAQTTEVVTVRFSGMKVAKLVYPTASRKQTKDAVRP